MPGKHHRPYGNNQDNRTEKDGSLMIFQQIRIISLVQESAHDKYAIVYPDTENEGRNHHADKVELFAKDDHGT